MTRDEARQFVRDYDYHGHQIDIIRKYAEGAILQYQVSPGVWSDLPLPDNASLGFEAYRVKPKAIEVKGWVCHTEHLGYRVGNVIGDGMVPLVPTNWKEFTTTVEV